MVQISAYINPETKKELEYYSKYKGMKKSFLVEEALNFHFRALREIPEMFMIPSRIIVDDIEFEKILKSDDTPTKELKELLHDN